jgi:uncharacterized protein (TIGR03663 family)
MPRTVLYLLLLVVVLAAALAIRIPAIENRPLHGDEANQAVKAGMLFDNGVYHYDPFEHHGPTLYYLTLPVLKYGGAGTFAKSRAWHYRVVPLAAAMAMITLLWLLLRKGAGRDVMLWAAIFTAFSPAMVFYSTYYIQEMLLVFLTFFTVWAGWHWLRGRAMFFAILAGAGIGLMHATKETCLVIWFCMAAALGGVLLLARFRDGLTIDFRDRKRLWQACALAIAAAAVSFVLYTSFFTHWRGPLDSILTWANYLRRAEGEGSTGIHDKPWTYYLQILTLFHKEAGPVWSEIWILFLAVPGILYALLRRNPEARQRRQPEVLIESDREAPAMKKSSNTENIFEDVHLLRFLALFAILLTAVFSLIPYKTPWNMLVFLQTLILLAGLGAALLLRWTGGDLRIVLTVALLMAVAHGAWLARLGTSRYAADVRNPYVYAHTSAALLRMADQVRDIAAVHPDGRNMHINIYQPDGDYWPLPWYLRDFTRVGYWTELPPPPEAPVLIADVRLARELDEYFTQDYQIASYSLRPGILRHLWVRQPFWEKFLAARE